LLSAKKHTFRCKLKALCRIFTVPCHFLMSNTQGPVLWNPRLQERVSFYSNAIWRNVVCLALQEEEYISYFQTVLGWHCLIPKGQCYEILVFMRVWNGLWLPHSTLLQSMNCARVLSAPQTLHIEVLPAEKR
jgi:hypothetical protein